MEKTLNRQQILAALDWQRAMGADEALGDTPAAWGSFAQPNWWRQAKLGRQLDRPVAPLAPQVPAPAPVETLFPLPTAGPARLTTPTEITVAAQTLAALAEEWKASDHCGLKKTALSFVFGEGDPAKRIMLIGEGPGADEDKQGRPFVGRSGQLLDKMLAAIGLNSRADYYITNVTPWRPPGNRTPTDAEITVLRPYLIRHIELAAPQVIVTLGGLATKALLGRPEGITKLRGKFLDFAVDGVPPIKLLPLFHPSALLRNPANKKQSWQDLLTLQAYLSDSNLLPSNDRAALSKQ